jgi:hypothetical protein
MTRLDRKKMICPKPTPPFSLLKRINSSSLSRETLAMQSIFGNYCTDNAVLYATSVSLSLSLSLSLSHTKHQSPSVGFVHLIIRRQPAGVLYCSLISLSVIRGFLFEFPSDLNLAWEFLRIRAFFSFYMYT